MDLTGKFFKGCFKLRTSFFSSLDKDVEGVAEFFEKMKDEGVVDNPGKYFFPMNFTFEGRDEENIWRGRFMDNFGKGVFEGAVSQGGCFDVNMSYVDVSRSCLRGVLSSGKLKGQMIELPLDGRIEAGGTMDFGSFSCTPIYWGFTYNPNCGGLVSPGYMDIQLSDPREPSGVSLDL